LNFLLDSTLVGIGALGTKNKSKRALAT